MSGQHEEGQANCRTKLGNVMRGMAGFSFTWYWLAGLIDTSFLLAPVALGFSWPALGVGGFLTGVVTYCDYKVHLTQDTQNQTSDAKKTTAEVDTSNTSLNWIRNTRLKGAFACDILAVAGGLMGIADGVTFRATKDVLTRSVSLGAFAATSVYGFFASRPEYYTHKESQLVDQAQEDARENRTRLIQSPV